METDRQDDDGMPDARYMAQHGIPLWRIIEVCEIAWDVLKQAEPQGYCIDKRMLHGCYLQSVRYH